MIHKSNNWSVLELTKSRVMSVIILEQSLISITPLNTVAPI